MKNLLPKNQLWTLICIFHLCSFPSLFSQTCTVVSFSQSECLNGNTPIVSFSIGGLTANTSYEVYLQSNLGIARLNQYFSNASGVIMATNVNANSTGCTQPYTFVIYAQNQQPPASPLFTCSSGALPIELIDFIGKQVENTITLKWETASEKDNAYMEVQRSKDGINFVPLHQEKGYGTTSSVQQHNWTDAHPLAGINYYRLKQVDYDGKYEYHLIIAVAYNGKVTQAGIRLFPTVVKDQITIALDTPTTDKTMLYVIDMLGRIVQQHPIGSGVSQQEISVPTLPQGQYFITLQSGKTVQTARFVKL